MDIEMDRNIDRRTQRKMGTKACGLKDRQAQRLSEIKTTGHKH